MVNMGASSARAPTVGDYVAGTVSRIACGRNGHARLTDLGMADSNIQLPGARALPSAAKGPDVAITLHPKGSGVGSANSE